MASMRWDVISAKFLSLVFLCSSIKAIEARGPGKDPWCTVGSTCETSPPFDIAVDYDSDYFWIPVAWNPCSNKCGGGTQTAALACFASNLTKVRSIYCQDLPTINIEQPCNAVECPSYTVHRSPWSECSKSCGTGYQTRKVFCRDNFGSLVAYQNCDLEENYVESRLCNTDACDTSYWTVPPWSVCDSPCGGGKQRRIPTCHSSRRDSSICSGEKPRSEQSCNTQACSTHAWLVGPWKPCPYECQATAKRFVQCVDGYGFEQPDSECPGSKPTITTSCVQPHISCTDCLYDCFGHGGCKLDKCSCYDGWIGKYCQIPETCHGFLGYSDQDKVRCCDLVDVNQRCCSSGASLDKDGNCCPSRILSRDGVCDGIATAIDFEGKPCSTVRDEKGICCDSGVLDECHICDGDGTSCSMHMTFYLNVTGSSTVALENEAAFPIFLSSTMNLLAYKLRVAGESLSVTGVRMINPEGDPCSVDTLRDSPCFKNDGLSGLAVVNATILPRSPELVITQRKDVLAALQPGPLSSPSLSVVPQVLSASLLFVGDVGRVGVCGNGLCERGERCTSDGFSATTLATSCCLQDCPYVSAACPAPMAGPRRNQTCSGAGVCMEASGQCDCFKGYADADCSTCSWGWIQTPSGFCVMLPDPQTLAKLAAVYKNETVKVPGHARHRKGIDTSGTIILVVLCGVCLALLLLLIIVEHHQDRRAQVQIHPAFASAGNNSPGSGEKLTKWPSSRVGPQSEYDVIPITPRRPKQIFDTKLSPRTSTAGEPSQLWSSRRSFFTTKDSMSSSGGGGGGGGRKNFRDALPGLELHSSSNFLTTNEDLTEEEQAKMSQQVKKTMPGTRSAKFVTGYLTDSEDSDDGGDGKNTHCCTPESRAVVPS